MFRLLLIYLRRLPNIDCPFDIICRFKYAPQNLLICLGLEQLVLYWNLSRVIKISLSGISYMYDNFILSCSRQNSQSKRSLKGIHIKYESYGAVLRHSRPSDIIVVQKVSIAFNYVCLMFQCYHYHSKQFQLELVL